MEGSFYVYALALAFALVGLLCLAIVMVGLPGIWLLLGLAVVGELVWPASFGWALVGLCAGLAALGEAVEFVAGAAGAKYGGAGRRGMIGAIVGGIAGAIFLTPLLPIPVVGTLLGAVAGSFLGAFAAEATGPAARGREHNLRAALGAAAGKLGGTLGKLAVGCVMWVLLVRAAFQI